MVAVILEASWKGKPSRNNNEEVQQKTSGRGGTEIDYCVEFPYDDEHKSQNKCGMEWKCNMPELMTVFRQNLSLKRGIDILEMKPCTGKVTNLLLEGASEEVEDVRTEDEKREQGMKKRSRR